MKQWSMIDIWQDIRKFSTKKEWIKKISLSSIKKYVHGAFTDPSTQIFLNNIIIYIWSEKYVVRIPKRPLKSRENKKIAGL